MTIKREDGKWHDWMDKSPAGQGATAYPVWEADKNGWAYMVHRHPEVKRVEQIKIKVQS